MEIWTKILDVSPSHCVDAIYLDFAKAFDTVPHKRLMLKLRCYGITGKVYEWIEDFLSKRRQLVVINGAKSDWTPVLSGIPQGSVLGPMLFVCYINDLPDVVHTMIQMFADDAKVFKEIIDVSDCEKLADDLARLDEWSNRWLLKFNTSKCKVMRLGTKSPAFDYQMGPTGSKHQLEVTSEERDLGVIVDDTLKYDKHAESTANKGTSILAMIRRAYVYLDGPSLVLLYKSLIRPHLEYGNVVWAPVTQKNITLIENVQRRATKLVPEIRNLTYENRLRRLKLPSLVYRRARGDMIEVYKYLHGAYRVDVSFLPLDSNSITRGHSLKLTKQRNRLQLRQHFFSQRVVDRWNSLTELVVTAPTLNSFKARLDSHWIDYLYSLNPPRTRTAVKFTVKFSVKKPIKDQLTGLDA
jgi:hypothetical protein